MKIYPFQAHLNETIVNLKLKEYLKAIRKKREFTYKGIDIF